MVLEHIITNFPNTTFVESDIDQIEKLIVAIYETSKVG